MRRIVILGAGESGAGAAALAKVKGFDVFVSDKGLIKEEHKNVLRKYDVPWEEGKHTEELVLNACEVVKSPGIPDNAPMVQKVRDAGIPIISEIEFAGRYTDAKMICITGSNGKTTTTSLIYHIFLKAGKNVGLAGNIGRSLALQIAEGKQYDYYVIELSSFQLDNMYDFRANIAILMNITPDHLDRYEGSMQKYADAKMRIVQNQTDEDAFIYWNDDPIISHELRKYGIRIKAQKFPFSYRKSAGEIAYITDDGQYVIEWPTPFNMEQESLSLSGRHNMYNSLAAGIAARVSGIDDKTLRESLSSFEPPQHRMQKVGRVAGVQYIDDSKATNVDACWYALDSLPDNSVVLILGGLDKGNDYNAKTEGTSFKELVRKKCRGLVFLGKDNTKLHEFFDGMGISVEDTHEMKACVEACSRMAKLGDTVLLSPCCASFDLFENMADRGNQFAEQVKNL